MVQIYRNSADNIENLLVCFDKVTLNQTFKSIQISERSACSVMRSNAEVTAAISYPGLAAFPTRGVQAVYALLGEPLVKGSHSSAAVTKPDCHLDILKTSKKKKSIVEYKDHKQLSLHIFPNIASPTLQLCLHTCSADIMEDAQ